ncbi:MAG: hypothetical protein J6B43_02830, partial [Lachnospiraceae bacterium]|nr:hypothetical protein [Lachnospiraceae bacterium]
MPGAEGYLLFLINKDETGLWEKAKVFAEVKGTEWTDEAEALEIDGSVVTLNERFKQYYISDDSGAWMDDAGVDWGIDENTAYDEFYSEYFGVIAYNAQGCSTISNLLSAMDLSHMLPATQADYSNEDSFYGINATLDLPAVMCVTMCDGSTAQKVLDYDMDSLNRDEENDSYTITARALQTPFTREFLVYGHDWDTLEEDLVALEERQEKLQNRGGNVAPSISVDEEPAEEPVQEPEETAPAEEEPSGEEQEADLSSIWVTANSAMSEYVALQMLSTNDAIDLSAFPEAADVQKIKDAFFEAQYQNPLILGVQGGSIDTENRILYVNYDFDRETTAAKQEEIESRV